MTRADFNEACFAYCKILQANETSGTRTERHNTLEGGVQHSAHIAGLGRDVTYDTPLPVDERKNWANRLGLHLVAEDTHDHLQPNGWMPG